MDLIGNVSNLSIVNMVISAVLCFLVPIGLIVFLGIKKKLNLKATLFGALLFVIFAMILERIMHVLVLGTDPTKSAIFEKPILYMLYGGLAAGIFEETARLLCFKSILKIKEDGNLHTGISYGLGHGGIEAILLGGLASISNLLTSVMFNSGKLKDATAAMSGDTLEKFNQAINALIDTPSYVFLITGLERMIALVLQVALTLFVFKAVREKKWQYFVYAIVIHAGIDMIALLYGKGVIENIFVVEGIILISTVLVAIAAFKINKQKPVNEQSIVA